MSRPVKRRYDASTRRAAAQATRERICAAAETLFLRDGYARTSIRAVADEAGVAQATVYLVFSTKAALLDATILRATRDDDGKPLSTLLGDPARDILRRVAASHAATLHRAARLIALGESASLMDAALRPLRDRAHANLRAAYTAVAERLAEAQLLRPELRRPRPPTRSMRSATKRPTCASPATAPKIHSDTRPGSPRRSRRRCCAESPVVWELGMLVRRGRLSLDRDVARWVRHALADARVAVLAPGADIALAAALLDETFPGDAADRLIYATARHAGAPLVTRDARIARFDPDRAVW
jgi:AcrR family transcriptional regulator